MIHRFGVGRIRGEVPLPLVTLADVTLLNVCVVPESRVFVAVRDHANDIAPIPIQTRDERMGRELCSALLVDVVAQVDRDIRLGSPADSWSPWNLVADVVDDSDVRDIRLHQTGSDQGWRVNGDLHRIRRKIGS